MSRVESERAAGTAAPAEAMPARASVLMVDDQPARLLTYEAILAGLGVQCVRALSGNQALERLLKQDFAVILLDVNMPGMDGFETARLIRQHPRLGKTPIIFVTGVNVSELDQLRGYEVGAIDYIAVPVIPEILRSKVAILVELHQRRSELQTVNQALATARAQRDAEHASAAAEWDQQLNTILEHPTEVTAVLQAQRDAGGVVQEWRWRHANAQALQLFGLSREALYGRTLREVLPRSATRLTELCNQVLDTRQMVRHPCRIAHQDLQLTLFAMGRDSVICFGVDVTEHKRTEVALRTSEGRYHALIENAPVAVAHNAMDGRFEYVNKAFCRLVGYTAEELLNRTWQDITHPEDLADDQSLARRVIAGELPHYAVEKRYVRKDGSCVWVNLFGNFVLDESGQPMQGVAIVIDITERKRADALLRESSERLLLANSAAQLGTHDWDVRSGVIRWDARTCELWGVDPCEHVTYEVFAAAVHPDDIEGIQRAVDSALNPDGNGNYFAAYRVINRRDGRIRWIEATGRVIFENRQPLRLVGTVQEVTERVLADEKLRSSEERFRELANNIDQFAWTCDRLGQVTWYNDRWYQYTGTTLAQMAGEGWRSVQHPAHLDRVAQHLARCMETGQPWEDTFPLRGKDGRYRWFLSRAVPIRAESGEVVRWFGTNTNVTEQRNLQDALKQQDRRKDEFLAMLAHELRNPAAAISNATAVLARVLSDSDAHRPLISVIQRQTMNLSRLLDDLLDMARITQGRIELRREVIPLSACLDLALETAQPLIRDKHHRLTVTQTFQPLYVDADKVRLAQCVANLLSNAAKYTEAGGEICIRSYAQQGMAVIEVTDTGAGIAPDFLPHAFDLFAQSERALDRSQGGLGVGLAICRQLIEMHGGSVAGASAGLGQGAAFTIRIPLVIEPARTCVTAPTQDNPGLRVLIVDDNRDAADSLAMLLEIEGHQTTAVYSGEQALAQAPILAPELVLLDIGLPQMNGYEVARRMKDIIPSARLIALTGYGQPEDRDRSVQAGFDEHLVKPVDITALEKAIAQR